MRQVRLPRWLPLILAGICLLGFLLWLGFGLRSRQNEGQRLTDAHTALLHSLETNQRGKLRGFIAKDYHDALGHNRSNALDRLMDLRAEFAELKIHAANTAPVISAENPGAGEVDFQISEIDGQGGPLAAPLLGVMRESRRTKIQGLWRREGLWPGRWRLVELRFEPPLDLPAGYDPNQSLRQQLRSAAELP